MFLLLHWIIKNATITYHRCCFCHPPRKEKIILWLKLNNYYFEGLVHTMLETFGNKASVLQVHVSLQSTIIHHKIIQSYSKNNAQDQRNLKKAQVIFALWNSSRGRTNRNISNVISVRVKLLFSNFCGIV